VTVRLAVPEISPTLAPIVVVPAAAEVARPLSTGATEGCVEVHVAIVVRFCVVPSVNIPVAANDCCVPNGIDDVGGVTEMETNWAAVTVSSVDPENPPLVAEIVVVPAIFEVASPPALIVATPEADDAQVTELVRTVVLPFVYVPVATNCCEVPAAIEGLAGVTAIETNAAGVTVRLADPDMVPTLATIEVVPGATEVAKPLTTVANPGCVELHVTPVGGVWVVPLV
jgi:hypothetical protein